MLGRLMVIVGGCGLLYVGVTTVTYIDRALNYVEVQARVDNVSSTCRLERKGYWVGRRRRGMAHDMDCDFVKQLLDEVPAMKGMHYTRTSRLMVRYTSPADRQVHSGSISFSARDDEQQAPQAGSVVGILANTSSPEKIQRL